MIYKIAILSFFSFLFLAHQSSCSKPDTIDESKLVVEAIKMFNINGDSVYVNFNINNTNIAGLVDNDGIPGHFFILELVFPDGIKPISINPDLTEPLDFESPVLVDVQFTSKITKTYSLNITEKGPNPDNFDVNSVEVLDQNNQATTLNLSKVGNDFIGLSRDQGTDKKYRLKLNFRNNIIPISINPNPNESRGYDDVVNFEVHFDQDIKKTYSVKIGNYNTNEFKRDVVRGVWVSDVGSTVFDSKSNIEECVNICKDIGINTIFVVTYNNATTKYPSEVMKEYLGREIDNKYIGRDPLREMIDAAKPHGIKVVAWFEYGFASVFGDNTGGLIVGKFPSWGSRDFSGNITERNNFYWLDAFNPDVQTFIRRMMTEVVEKYPDIDGVQGDDRLPAMPSNGGYNASVIQLYKKETGREAPSNTREAHWMQWRANKLSDFGEYIFKHIKSMGSKYMVSWSPSPYPWSYENYLQDSPEWMRRNIVDHLHPQIYRTNFTSYKASFDQALGYVKPFAFNALIFSPGVLVGVGSGDSITPEILDQKLQYNREQGIMGETFFYYERIRRNKGFQDVIKKYNN